VFDGVVIAAQSGARGHFLPVSQALANFPVALLAAEP
jgi:hypothetical protein